MLITKRIYGFTALTILLLLFFLICMLDVWLSPHTHTHTRAHAHAHAQGRWTYAIRIVLFLHIYCLKNTYTHQANGNADVHMLWLTHNVHAVDIHSHCPPVLSALTKWCLFFKLLKEKFALEFYLKLRHDVIFL
jgi:cytochrome bd-type quinol oxidase subunit 2